MISIPDIATVRRFFAQQLAEWPEAAARFDALSDCKVKDIEVEGFPVRVQFNPSRIRSSAAKVDKASISARPCFLCDVNRPAEQIHLEADGYKILVNPFPICPFHLTIPDNRHSLQAISGRLNDMVAFARALRGCVVFYNGPRCGASAPDHFHFQAVGRESLPIVDAIDSGDKLPMGVAIYDGEDTDGAVKFLSKLQREAEETEPKVNILAWSDGTRVRIAIIPRRKHRPDFYGEGADQVLVSPASVDLAGLFVAPRIEDFEALTPSTIGEIYRQLCYSADEIKSIK